jgi:hypothetical protein
MRCMSLLRASANGIGRFATLTTALAAGFSIAITGPPTNGELAEIGELVAGLWAEFETPEGHDNHAAPAPTATAKLTLPPPSPEPVPAPQTEPAPRMTTLEAHEPALLGGADAPRVTHVTPAPRPAIRARSVRRAPPPPGSASPRLPPVAVARLERLPAAQIESALGTVQSTPIPELRNDSPSTDKEATSWRGPSANNDAYEDERRTRDDGEYDDDTYAVEPDDDAYEEEDLYDEDDHVYRRYRPW